MSVSVDKPTGRARKAKAEASRAAKDREYLARLETLRRSGTPTWPADFAKRLGFRSKNALRRYPLTLVAVNAYGWRMAPSKMRGPRPGAVRDRAAASGDVAASAALASSEAARVAERVAADRLRRTLDAAEVALAAERAAHQETRRSLDAARALVDWLDEEIARRAMTVAADLQRELHAAAARVTGRPERPAVVDVPPVALVPDESPPGGPPPRRPARRHPGRPPGGRQ